MRREFLQKSTDGHGERLEPVPAPALIELATGEAYAKFAGGRAVKIVTPPPLTTQNHHSAEAVIARSWERYGTSPFTPPGSSRWRPEPETRRRPRVGKPEDFLE